MSSSSLTDWSKSSINALFESSLPEPPGDSQNIAQRAFVEDPNVTFNHSALPFQDFRGELGARFGAATGIQIDWKDCFEDVNAGIFAGYVVVTRSMKFRIRAGPAQTHTYATISLKIEGKEEQRRISRLIFTSVDRAASIHLLPS